MKILMLVNWKVKYCDSIPNNLQPPDYYIKGEKYWFFRYFKKQDIDVDVVDISSFGWLEKFEQNTIRFYIWQTLKCLFKFNKYDLVVSHGMQSGIVLCLLRRLFGHGRYKHIVFDIGAFNSAKEEGKSLKLMQYASKSLDGVIYHTKSQIEYYKKCYPWLLDKCKYVPFGTDFDFFTDVDYAELNNKNCNKKQYILCVGSNKRDWKTLIDAYLMTNQKYILRLIGKTDLEINSINKSIEIIGHVSIDELKNQIRDAAFCVLPLQNMNYSFGQMTLLQQMAMGKAVIVADVPSVSEYLNRESTVRYVAGDTSSLRDCIQKLMDDSELCKKLGHNASEAIKNKYNEENMAIAIEEVLV